MREYTNTLKGLCVTCLFLRNVVGLAIGYSKAIVVDMAICLQVFFQEQFLFALMMNRQIIIFQGDEENELPEVIIGGCSCVHVDMSKAKKL